MGAACDGAGADNASRVAIMGDVLEEFNEDIIVGLWFVLDRLCVSWLRFCCLLLEIISILFPGFCC